MSSFESDSLCMPFPVMSCAYLSVRLRCYEDTGKTGKLYDFIKRKKGHA